MTFLILTIVLCAVFGTINATVNICDGITNNMFLPYYGDCSKYYVCMNGLAIPQACDGDTLFDAKNQTCTYPDLARCMPTCPPSALTSFCYDRTCTKYVMCYAGNPVVRECCDGLQYNAETDRCDFPQYVDCVDNMCTIFNDITNITFLQSKAACDKYFVCVDGLAVDQTCSSGLQFNPVCNCCDLPERVNCTITLLKRNILSYSKAPPRSADINCPSEGIYFYPHARSDAYYFCTGGRGVTLDCTPGLVYDAAKEECREPQFVDKPIH